MNCLAETISVDAIETAFHNVMCPQLASGQQQIYAEPAPGKHVKPPEIPEVQPQVPIVVITD
jgi:hypothetical protein